MIAQLYIPQQVTPFLAGQRELSIMSALINEGSLVDLHVLLLLATFHLPVYYYYFINSYYPRIHVRASLCLSTYNLCSQFASGPISFHPLYYPNPFARYRHESL